MDKNNPLIVGNDLTIKRLLDLMERGEPETLVGRVSGVPIMVSLHCPDNEIFLRGSDGRWTKMIIDDAATGSAAGETAT